MPADIKPESFYDQDSLGEILGVSIKAIGIACRRKELRFTERAGRRFFRGQWIIDWLEGSKHEARPIEASDLC